MHNRFENIVHNTEIHTVELYNQFIYTNHWKEPIHYNESDFPKLHISDRII